MGTVRTLARWLVPRPIRQGIHAFMDADFRMRLDIQRDMRAGRMVFDHAGRTVHGGPFKGMQYPPADFGFTVGPKILGTYEMELNAIVEKFIAADYPEVVNVGSGEGYYAVGLAMRMPRVRVIAFEADARKQKYLKTLAELNGVVDRIEVRGLATAADLATTLDVERPVLICDVEGAELELLNPRKAEPLRRTTVLAEMHDVLHRGLSREIHARFDSTHDVTVIGTRRRQRGDWPAGVPCHRQWAACLSEGRRGRMTWSYFQPRDTR